MHTFEVNVRKSGALRPKMSLCTHVPHILDKAPNLPVHVPQFFEAQNPQVETPARHFLPERWAIESVQYRACR